MYTTDAKKRCLAKEAVGHEYALLKSPRPLSIVGCSIETVICFSQYAQCNKIGHALGTESNFLMIYHPYLGLQIGIRDGDHSCGLRRGIFTTHMVLLETHEHFCAPLPSFSSTESESNNGFTPSNSRPRLSAAWDVCMVMSIGDAI